MINIIQRNGKYLIEKYITDMDNINIVRKKKHLYTEKFVTDTNDARQDNKTIVNK